MKRKTKERRPMLDTKALELIYRNSETREEMDLALAIHGISYDELVGMAMENGWASSPATIRNLASCLELGNTSSEDEVDPKYIEASNRASIRRLHKICEHVVTRFQVEMASAEISMSLPAAIDSLSNIVKIREKLTRLEYPMYGLSTVEPQVPVNPINLFFADPSPQGDNGEQS